MTHGDPHAPSIPRSKRHTGHVRAAIVCGILGALLLIGAIYIFAFVPMADLPYLMGGLMIGGAFVFFYISMDRWKMANYKSEVEDLIERGDRLLKDVEK